MRRRSAPHFAVFSSVCFALSALAPSSPAQAADPQAGRQKYEMCAACHGDAGISTVEGIPSIAGQLDQFVEWQLVFFRTNRRKDEAMQAVAAQLSNDDIRDLGAFVATLDRPSPTLPPDAHPETSAKGKQIAAERHCANCHGEEFGGLQAAPWLAAQREEYLAKALKDYRSDQRPSTGVAAMNEMAASLSDEDITALAHFLSQFALRPKP